MGKNIKQPITIAIDTSCDETSVAVVRGVTVLSNVLPSQMKYHKKYGGVVPNLARLAHEERIDNVVKESMKKAGVTFDDIDVVAVTLGPGLAIALEVGIRKAKELAKKYNKPIFVINHMEGHLLSQLAQPKKRKGNTDPIKTVLEKAKKKMPILGFLISGGHTELVLVKDFLHYKKVGETLDDSCGEAYDKCGRMLGFGYPAGPIITEFAKQHRKSMRIDVLKQDMKTLVHGVNMKTGAEYFLPIPLARTKDLSFSYSGLKTSFKYLLNDLSGHEITLEEEMEQDIKGLTKDQIYDLCVVFEAAALEHLALKLELALQKYKVSQVWLGGGVVASARLRSVLRSICKKHSVILKYPYSDKLTGDNAAMIGVAANVRLDKLGVKLVRGLGEGYPPMLKLRRTSKPAPAIKISELEEYGLYIESFEKIDREAGLSL